MRTEFSRRQLADPALQRVNERIKAGFDPHNLFNPGRLPATAPGPAHAH